VLLITTPAQLQGAANAVTAGELSQDPHDLIANLILQGASHLHTAGLRFVAAYLLLHGVVKVAVVIALLIGSRRVYPWAMAAQVSTGSSAVAAGAEAKPGCPWRIADGT
jgi:uncharacterized membrane protein